MAGVISFISGLFGGTAVKVISVAFILLLGLYTWEKRTNAGLYERLGSLESVSAGQARAIDELQRERARAELALVRREVEYAGILEQLGKARAALEEVARNDPDFAAWRGVALPAAVLGVLGGAGGGANGSYPADASGGAAYGDARSSLAWRE